MIYRIFLVAVIAIVIIGLSALFYEYYINVRGAEAKILAKQVVNCLAPNGEIKMMELGGSAESDLLGYCGMKNTERLFVRAHIRQENSPDDLNLLKSGDEGVQAIKNMYDKLGAAMNSQNKFEPGSYGKEFPVNIVMASGIVRGKLIVEVIVGNDE